MAYAQLDINMYHRMKEAVKPRGYKVVIEQDIYKMAEPYFLSAFYFIDKVEDGKIDIILEFSIKYARFDELQYGILRPDNEIRFTDKRRANSGMMCRAPLERMVQSFDYGGTDEELPHLCNEVLDFIEDYFAGFIDKTLPEYGDLDDYFIANREAKPRLAGLAYLDRGEAEAAYECFNDPNMDGANNILTVELNTDEQRIRAEANGEKIFKLTKGYSTYRNMKNQLVDYTIALKNGLEWTIDRALYGLLPEEREVKPCES